MSGPLHRRLTRGNGSEHESPGPRAPLPRLYPGPDRKLLRTELRPVRPPEAEVPGRIHPRLDPPDLRPHPRHRHRLHEDEEPRTGPGRRLRHPATGQQHSGPIAGFLWGAGTVAALGFLGYYVYSKAEVKQDPNQTMPMAAAQGGGQQMPAQQQQPAQADPAVQKLEQEVSADPNNADKRIALARMYLDKENMMGVFEQTNAVLGKNPNDARAQTYNAIVRMAMGQLDQATSMLDTATKNDPKLADAWVALAWIRVQKGDKAGAKTAIDSAIENVPA